MKNTTPQGYVYIIHATGTNRIKLGFSNEPEKRLADLQTGSPFPLALIGTCPGSAKLERRLHSQLKDRHRTGEWFEIDPQEALKLLLDASKQEEARRISIYDVPGVTLEARHEARALLKHPDPEVQASAQRIIDLLSRSIQAMGREDLGVLQVVGDSPELPLDAQPAA